MRTIFTKLLLLLAIAAIVTSLPAYSCEANVAHRTTYPKELHGVWDVAPYDCSASNKANSDTMFEIRARSLHGYENTDDLMSIKRISESPLAWRVVTISDVAPIDIQGDANIYILNDDKLTISNGSSTETFIRCK